MADDAADYRATYYAKRVAAGQDSTTHSPDVGTDPVHPAKLNSRIITDTFTVKFCIVLILNTSVLNIGYWGNTCL